MRENMLFSDAQGFIDEDSAGTKMTNVFDLEKDSAAAALITDDMIIGYMNVIVTAYSYTSGGDEGMTLQLRMDDATGLATTKTAEGAGFVSIGSKEIELIKIKAGMKISIPFIEPVSKRYIGGFLLATSTAFVGTITIDAWIDNKPISGNESIQKVPA